MGARSRISGWVIDMHELDARTPPQGPEHHAANAAKTIDSDSHRRKPNTGVKTNQPILMHQAALMQARAGVADRLKLLTAGTIETNAASCPLTHAR
jgi:hypothetical protein